MAPQASARDKQDLDLLVAVLATHPSIEKTKWDRVQLVTRALGYDWSTKTLSNYWSERVGRHTAHAVKVLEQAENSEIATQLGAATPTKIPSASGAKRKRRETSKVEGGDGLLGSSTMTPEKLQLQQKENLPFKAPVATPGPPPILAPRPPATVDGIPIPKARAPLPATHPPHKGPAAVAVMEAYEDKAKDRAADVAGTKKRRIATPARARTPAPTKKARVQKQKQEELVEDEMVNASAADDEFLQSVNLAFPNKSLGSSHSRFDEV